MSLQIIETESPTAWKDFVKFYKEAFGEHVLIKSIEFSEFPFEIQLGVFLKYFNENGLEWDIQNVPYSEWPLVVAEVFKVQEKVIGHFS